MKKISIIGAGLVGSLLTIYLARRGYEIDVFESRPDIRITSKDSGRSINLAMSCRGLTGLAGAGIVAEVEKLMVPMRARAIHEEHGAIKYQSFGRHHDEHINAIQRSDLNKMLLNEAEKYPSVHWNFDTRLLSLDVPGKLIHFERPDGSKLTKAYDLLIGADGAGSAVRDAMQQQNLVSASRSYLPYGYKEIGITGSGPQLLAHEHLHLWPRQSFLLLGNPNLDNSVTGSLFMATDGKDSFAELDNEAGIHAFCRKAFPDVYATMPDLVGDFLQHATGRMSTVTCAPWYYEDNCLLIGDAAHGLVPFFGQGMNSGFEDCRILNDLLDQYHDDWARVMPAFYQSRKPNTDAVAEMSMGNYHEIQTDILDEHFNLKKQLEQQLMQRYPERYVSKHVLVMFTNTPYSTALAHGRVQSELLNQICTHADRLDSVDWLRVDDLMKDYDNKLAKLSL